ncbi:hypothetical protein ACFQ0B_28095 [Nonomuraea thailandensis]
MARLGLILGVGLLAAGLIWAVLNSQSQPATLTKAAAQASVPPQAPAAWGAEVTAPGSTGSALKSLPRKSALPRPAPPVARLSPSSLWLGTGRSGTFSLACTGRCEITSATGTNGIAVSGNRVRVRSPQDPCDLEPGTHRGRVAVRWTGRATGDGRTTGGVTTGGGTLTLDVAWTVGRSTDDDIVMLDVRGGTRLSPCD